MRYGSLEYRYAAPFAEALVSDSDFRAWVVQQTKFSADAEAARLMHREMQAKRSAKTATWWRSHYTEVCRCAGCSGQETDLMAVFERSDGSRFALHCEVKQPTDDFPATKDQGGNYARRALCWTEKPPRAILSHSDAQTLLLCSEGRLADYAENAGNFDVVLTFEQIKRRFPHTTATE